MADRALEACHSIMDIRSLAQRRLPAPVFHYLDGAAETESTARHNTEAFDSTRLIPRALVNVSQVNTTIEVLGRSIAWPVLCAPTGASRLYHADGELSVARAAARAGTYYSLSVAATHSLEEVARASTGPKIFQFLLFKDRGLTHDLIERCREAGYAALCLTVDATVRGKRERELRHGMGMPPRPSLASVLHFAARPRWLLRQALRGPLSLQNVAPQMRGMRAGTRYLGQQLDTAITWEDAQRLVERWGGPFAIKGILAAEDARRAADVGFSCVVISNHGGRQLDSAAAPYDVLPGIADAVGDRLEIILDGGIRRGVHVLKALARGARACMVGRPYLFGLAAGGEAGVTRALDILGDELVRAMQLCGCADVRRIDQRILAHLT
jgi:L-lactate dehydrogenase (cytochrome)